MTTLLKRWLIAGAVAYLLFLLLSLPARFIVPTLEKRGIRTGEVTGSLWHGQAQNLQVGVLNVGQVQWRWRFLPLFLGRLAADVDIRQPEGQLQGRLALSITGKVLLSNLHGALPLQSLVGSNGLPGGWVARAELDMDELVLKDRWPVQAKGRITLRDFTGPASSPTHFGNYQLTFPANGKADNNALVASLKELPDSALAIDGTLTFTTNRNYVLDAKASTTPTSPGDFAKTLSMLGPPDGSGKYPLSISGSF